MRETTELRRIVAKRIRQARRDAGFTSMEEGARRARVHSSILEKHEAGKQLPKIFMIQQYAKAFGVSPAWLAFGIK